MRKRSSKAKARHERLSEGYPLSDGRTPSSPPKTRRAKGRPAIDPGKGSGRIMKDKSEQMRKARRS